MGRAFEYGANICTIPPNVFEGMYKHILTEKGMQLFDNDYVQSVRDYADIIKDLEEGK